MIHQLAQREQSRIRMMEKAHRERVIATLKADIHDIIQRVRSEAFTVIYTEIEAAFGEQPDDGGFLPALDDVVRRCLKNLDARYWQNIEKHLRKRLAKNPFTYIVQKHSWHECTPEAFKTIGEIRDEMIDTIADFINQSIEPDSEKVKTWALKTREIPDLMPETIVANSLKRRPIRT